MQLFRKVRLLLLALLVSVTAVSINAQFSIAINVGFAPPMLPVYVQPMCPQPNLMWTPGYWAYSSGDGDYYWVPGAWVPPAYMGALWTPPYWGFSGGQYGFHGGYWGQQRGLLRRRELWLRIRWHRVCRRRVARRHFCLQHGGSERESDLCSHHLCEPDNRPSRHRGQPESCVIQRRSARNSARAYGCRAGGRTPEANASDRCSDATRDNGQGRQNVVCQGQRRSSGESCCQAGCCTKGSSGRCKEGGDQA